MELKRHHHILALKSKTGPWLGFHSENLQIAELPDDIWSDVEPLEAWSNEQDAETTWASTKKHVSTLSVNVAQVCNLACSYCAAGGDGTYGSTKARLDVAKFKPQLERFLNDLPRGETLNIHFLGGEPLLFPNLMSEIADFVTQTLDAAESTAEGQSKKSVRYTVTTNGTLINDRVLELFKRLRMGVTISLDGDREVNDRVRPAKAGNLSSTDMTLAGLRKLASIQSELDFISINCVFGAHNLQIMDSYRFLRSLEDAQLEGANVGTTALKFTYFNFNFSNKDKDPDVNAAYIKAMEELAEYVYNTEGLQGLSRIAQFRSIMSRLAAKARLQSYCGAGKTLLQVDTSNKIYPCNWFMDDATEVVGEGTSINNEALEHFAAPLYEANNCHTCFARYLCAGGCMAVHKAASGSKNQKDPQFCARSRSLAATAIYYFAASHVETEIESETESLTKEQYV
jgi:uncharacterized protein